jgi:hypothetical protein
MNDNLENTRDITEVVKDPRERKIVIESTTDAIFGKSQYLREEGIRDLQYRYQGKILGGFMGDNQLFLLMESGNRREIWYICDTPKEHSESKATRFNI